MTYESRKLHEVFTIRKGRKPELHAVKKPDDVPYLIAKVMRGAQEPEWVRRDDPNAVHVTEDEAIIICDGSNSGEVFSGFSGALSSTMAKIEPRVPINQTYLRRFLESNAELFAGTKTGAAIPHLDQDAMFNLEIPLPPLPEQQRIVRLLNEAFEGIDIAKANAEKNLQNVANLYQENLRVSFTQSGLGKIKTTIGEQLTLQRGFDITKEQQVSGQVPVVSSGGIKSYHNTSMANGPGVVIGRKGTLGKVFYLEKEYWPHDTTLWVKDFKGNLPKLAYYLFESLDVRKLDSGTANPALNRNQVHPIEIFWPVSEQQQEIVRALDSLSTESRRLARIYKSKDDALTMLKNALLSRAFHGELGVA